MFVHEVALRIFQGELPKGRLSDKKDHYGWTDRLCVQLQDAERKGDEQARKDLWCAQAHSQQRACLQGSHELDVLRQAQVQGQYQVVTHSL